MTGLREYRGSRALVLGASGFIGRWVASALSDHGADVIAAARDSHTAARVFREHLIPVDLRVADLAHAGEATKLVRAIRPAIVFNLAGYGVDAGERDEALAKQLNTDLIAELADAIDAHNEWGGQLLVHAGSALEFGTVGGDLSHPWHCAPTTLYGRTKLEGALRMRETTERRGLRALSARLFTVYGPGEHAGRLLPSLIEATHSAQELPLTAGTQQRDFTYVADVAEGLLRLGLVEHEFAPRALNLATGELHSVREFVEITARELEISRERLKFGALPTRPEEMAHAPVSLASLRALVGWTPTTSIADGVRRTRDFAAQRRVAG
jgi:nucleoside-diphosphate-sugar epimerase